MSRLHSARDRQRTAATASLLELEMERTQQQQQRPQQPLRPCACIALRGIGTSPVASSSKAESRRTWAALAPVDETACNSPSTCQVSAPLPCESHGFRQVRVADVSPPRISPRRRSGHEGAVLGKLGHLGRGPSRRRRRQAGWEQPRQLGPPVAQVSRRSMGSGHAWEQPYIAYALCPPHYPPFPA